jgi:cell fate (sporulation/competence/biofilm development) regulator YmcA (YheA/YmcA/DUF963 family)
LSEQVEAMRQAVQAKVSRSELQEVKRDSDEEVQMLQKVVKRLEERVNAQDGVGQLIHGL